MGQNSDLSRADLTVESLSKLTMKQREVLDLVLRHESSKAIARKLQISPYTVDQRIASARQKLGANSRGDLARKYALLLEICEEPVYEFSHVEDDEFSSQLTDRDQPTDPVFMLSDTPSIKMDLPWHLQPDPQVGLEAFDDRFGVLGRILIIVALAVLIAFLALAMTAIAMILPTVF
jgi:DNA-binding CsgD family transcriptional regulator